MTRAMVEPIRLVSKNPSKEEIKAVEKAVDKAWKKRNSAPDIKPADLSLFTRELSREEFKKLCGF